MLTEIAFLLKKVSGRFDCVVSVVLVETNYLTTDRCKSQSLQSQESREELADSLTAYSKPRAINCSFSCSYFLRLML